MTRDNDSEWFDVVNWVVVSMIAADELGVTSQNVAQMASDPPTPRSHGCWAWRSAAAR